MTNKTFEFTAYEEKDLNAGNIKVGSHFTMPGEPTVCFTVKDNDNKLSGDSIKNEQSNDKHGQTAEIVKDGQVIDSHVSIYAEKTFTVVDQNGHHYTLVEIERPGSGADFFSFVGDVPPAGARLDVVSCKNVTTKNEIKFEDISAGDKVEEPGWVKGRLTHDADCNDNEWNDQTGQWDEGIEGATVELLDLQGNVVATSVTDGYGNYQFDVPPGDYRVKFPLLEGKEFSAKDSGVDDHYDSDADASGLTDVITVKSGVAIHDVDAGLKDVEVPPNGDSICIEAEDLHLNGYGTSHVDAASGRELIKLKEETGYATLKEFPGESCVYDITLTVVDENDGEGFIDIFVDGEFVGCF
ncbi:MAG: SdrD B-like domain-containing protein, partial [Myxococcota bacterium]